MSTNKLKAFILGSTGQVGKALAHELAKTESVGAVTLFTRREVPVNQGDTTQDYSKFKVKVVNFDKLTSDHADDFRDFDLGYCSLGLIGIGSNEDKTRVDHDYVVEAAKLAKAGGCENFNVVSGLSADPEGRTFASRNKGLVEKDVSAIGFERVAFYRVGGLVGGDTSNLPLGYKLVNPLLKYLDVCRKISCEVPILADLMVHNSLKPATAAVTVYMNSDIRKRVEL